MLLLFRIGDQVEWKEDVFKKRREKTVKIETTLFWVITQ
jgi:hypothetical protein